MTSALGARGRSRRLLACATVVLLLAVPALARAEPSCAAAGAARESHRWPSPLDRLVTLHARDVALRDALDRLAAAARLRLSYSPELIALDRRVCVSYDSVAAGSVLADLLEGAAVTPVAVSDDQVVLTPTPATRHTADRAGRGVNMLDRVLVTTTPVRSSERGTTSAVDIIDRSQVARQSSGSLSQTLNGNVPGFWVWDQAPASLLAQFGSVRGASSFQVSYPKLYIDGIEVANPLLLTEVNPDAVERIEVIRGPQGAALYGSDAIAGVINIVMRHDAGDGEFASLRSSAGLAHSTFVSRPVLVQEHSLGLRGGDDQRSSMLSITLGSVGSYLPGAQSWNAKGDGGFKVVGARSMVTGTARLYAKDAGVGSSPLVSQASPAFASQTDRDAWRGGNDRDADHSLSRTDVPARQSVREYTLGSTATFFASEHWTHALTVGIDGYRLSGDPTVSFTPVLTSADSVLRAARGGADRATIRASSEARVGSAVGAAATVSLAAEHSALQQRSTVDEPLPLGSGDPDRAREYTGWQSNTGVIGQLDASWRNTLFATSGLRLERDDGLAATRGIASLPTLGGAAVHEFGPLMAKLRASYGKSIRPAASVVRSTWLAREAVVQGTLAPEQQSGIEAGLDAFFGHSFALHLTRFDQTAFDLIQRVVITSSLMPYAGDARALYALQNVGEISNRGWELESSLERGPLSLTATLALVDSRVRRLASAYSGDLRSGDRMLGVPAQTAGLTTSWTTPRWSTSFTVTRASDWIDYDGIALATAALPDHPIVGGSLRSFWRAYPGVTHLDLSASRTVFGGFGVVFTGRNLLDVQRGEPDNITVLPGRTLSVGLEAKF